MTFGSAYGRKPPPPEQPPVGVWRSIWPTTIWLMVGFAVFAVAMILISMI